MVAMLNAIPLGLNFSITRVMFVCWLDAANAFEEGAIVLDRVRAAQMADT